MAKSRIPTPKVSSLLPGGKGKGAAGRVRGGATVPGMQKLNHAASGNEDVVAQRTAFAQQGKAQRSALKKSRSTGLKP